MKYLFKKIEPKWQAKWEEAKVFEAKDNSDKPKFYGLVEFPYLFACFHAVGVVLVFDVHDAQLRQDLLFDDAPAWQFADGGLLPPHVFGRGEYGPHTGSLFF